MIHRAKPLSGFTNSELRTLLDESIRSEYAKEATVRYEPVLLTIKDSRSYFRESGISSARDAFEDE